MDTASEDPLLAAVDAVLAVPLPGHGVVWRRKRLATGIRYALNGIDSAASIIIVVALLSELSVVLTDITLRFLFTQSLLWSEEASKLCLTTLAFIGGALAYRAGHHLSLIHI